MDLNEMEPMDMLSYASEEVEERFKQKKDIFEQANLFEAYLRRWEVDAALKSLRSIKVEFQQDLDWFNVTESLSIEHLKGKIVVLDFFTYCCINCMHVLPELHTLEELFPIERGLVVVGVHSPKFENEKDGVNILAAAQRYGIKHPIVNDAHSSLWRSIGIRCWPTLLVLAPNGVPILLLMGEGHGLFLQRFVEQALRYFGHKGEINATSLPLRPSSDLLPASKVRFPSKIARSSKDGKFAVADAGNHRILIFDRDGTVQYKIGGCSPGFLDGDFGKARFNSPQGVAFLDEDRIMIADTENHALRQITLSTACVETLAGNGKQGSDRVGGKLGPLQSISSPWDVEVYRTRDMDMSFHADDEHIPEKSIVLISMAGTHQIWGYFHEGVIWWKFRKFEPKTCVSVIGSGHEENRNNSYPQNAAFAQPSGLALAEKLLYVADSESSSIRKVSMVDGKVMPVVGGDRNPLNLFQFGDVDGVQYNAKLQHPLGVAFNHVNKKVYVADTYNHKIKVIEPLTNAIETLLIRNEAGALHKFNEPAGLCCDATGKYLFVSDTNNHCIQLVNLGTLCTSPFNLDFAKLIQTSETDAAISANVRKDAHVEKRLPLVNCKKLQLKVKITLADDLKFTPEAPQRWRFASASSTLQSLKKSGELVNGSFALLLERLVVGVPSSELLNGVEENVKLELILNLCDAKTCLIKRFALCLTDSGAAGAVTLDENAHIIVTSKDILLQ